MGDDAAEVLGWIHDAKNGNLPEFHPLAGFVRIAFTHAFHYLYQASSYTGALRAVLNHGGDSDTNACIVGGILGALHGVAGIPGEMVSAVRNCDVTHGNQPRPEWLQTRQVFGLIDELMTGIENTSTSGLPPNHFLLSQQS